MIKNKNILITGGAGFFGTHLFETLIKQNNYIVIIDNLNEYYYKGKHENLKEVTNDYESSRYFKLISSDLLDESTYEKIEPEIDIIFHLANKKIERRALEH